MLKKIKAEIKQSFSDWLLAWKTENNELYFYIFCWLSMSLALLSAFIIIYLPCEKVASGIVIYTFGFSTLTCIIASLFLVEDKKKIE